MNDLVDGTQQSCDMTSQVVFCLGSHWKYSFVQPILMPQNFTKEMSFCLNSTLIRSPPELLKEIILVDDFSNNRKYTCKSVRDHVGIFILYRDWEDSPNIGLAQVGRLDRQLNVPTQGQRERPLSLIVLGSDPQPGIKPATLVGIQHAISRSPEHTPVTLISWGIYLQDGKAK